MLADFDGDREKGCAFLNSCSIYYANCGDHFSDDPHIHLAHLWDLCCGDKCKCCIALTSAMLPSRSLLES